MKLSEAIRLGAMLKPQAFHGEPNRPESCAMTAACEAAGIGTGLVSDYIEEWPWLGDLGGCPVCRHGGRISYVIACCLNDRHKWTRERIADWVAAIEPPDAPVAPACEVREEPACLAK